MVQIDLEAHCFEQDLPNHCAVMEIASRNEEVVHSINIDDWLYTDSIMLLSSSLKYVGLCSRASVTTSLQFQHRYNPIFCIILASSCIKLSIQEIGKVQPFV